MPRDFKLPDIGEGLTEAEIVRWLVAEGETVAADQPLVEVETDKAVVEIPSPFAGVVLQHGGAEGDVIEVGQVLAVIGEPGEVAGAPDREPPTIARSEPTASVPREPSPIVGTLSEEAETIEATRSESPPESLAVKALPIVRKLARENGIDLSEIEGTGPHGRITREDVEAVIARKEQEMSPALDSAGRERREQTESAPAGHDRRETMSRLRRTIAANMSKSWSEIPHVTTFDDVDATRLLEVRTALGERHGEKLPMEALVIRAVVPALDEFPEFNATLDGDDLIYHGAHDIGIAIDSPDGLLVAVIREAGQMGVLDLSGEIRRLGEKGKERTLAPDELGGQTFTVSNIGAVGGGHGTPIVPYGTTAILSVGRARERAIVRGGELVIAPVMPLSLSYDHRVVDGAQGRRFVAMVIENLEEPALFLA